MNHLYDGGYDVGYKAVPCFWGTEAGSLVREYLATRTQVQRATQHALDLGCGEGKNAAALADHGFTVEAVDCSSAALENGKKLFPSKNISWKQADIRGLSYEPDRFDLVVLYGVFHCMHDEEETSRLLLEAKRTTKVGGIHIVCTFNNRSHDLSAHEGFNPTLLSHSWYIDMYNDWEILSSTDTDLFETHPHNNIPHHHSMTRFIAKRLQ